MSGMDMGGSSSSSSASMSMMVVFNTDRSTPLFSSAWTPASTGGYAGTCLFLVLLATLFRGLLALKARQEARWLDAELRRRYVVVHGKPSLADNLSRDSLAKEAVLSENGLEERVVVVRKHTHHARPWRVSVDPVRAVIDTVIAGVGYLLYVPPSFRPPSRP